MKTTLELKFGRREYKWLLSQLAQVLSPAPNALYSAKDIARPILKASIENTFIESVCNHARGSGMVAPTGNDVFYHLAGKELAMHDVFACVDSMLKASMAKARKYIGLSKPLDIAIDCHDIPFYGKAEGELARWVVGCENKDGTNRCFRLITAHVVVRGRRFTIAAIPVSVFDNIPDLLGRLIAQVRTRVRIRHAFLDRGFYSVGCIQKLNGLDVGFVVPVIRHKGSGEKDIVQQLRQNYNAKNFRFSYTLGTKYYNVGFNVVVAMGKDDDVMGFATNTGLGHEAIGDHYAKRWGIETGYRVKEEFRARTCARNPAARLLLNMLPFALYNIWVLVNAALRHAIGHGRHLPHDRSYMTAYGLCKCIETLIDYG